MSDGAWEQRPRVGRAFDGRCGRRRATVCRYMFQFVNCGFSSFSSVWSVMLCLPLFGVRLDSNFFPFQARVFLLRSIGFQFFPPRFFSL